MDCLANIKFLDALDQPIQGLAHQFWVGSLLISEYVTPASGESVWIKRPVGTVIDIRIRSSSQGEYKSKVKLKLVGEKTNFIVRSPKVMLKGVNLSAKDVATGSYIRSTYVVAEGDYLSRIADDNATTVAELIRLNDLKSDTDIHPNQILKLPVKLTENSVPESKPKPQVTIPTKEKTTVVVVQRKDTLALIAKLTRNSVDEIKKLNGLTSDELSQNQKLKVYDRPPNKPKTAASPKPTRVTQPKVNQGASANKADSPVAKVDSEVAADPNGLLPEACGGEKHYKRALARIAELHPIYQPYVIKLINTGYQNLDICWTITDGYRSPISQGKLSGGVTNAGPLQSYHQYGLAIDIWSVRNGEIVEYDSRLDANTRRKLTIQDQTKLASIGESLGLVWGGRWKKPFDPPHFQLLPNGKTWRDLKPQLLKLGVSNYKKLTF